MSHHHGLLAGKAVQTATAPISIQLEQDQSQSYHKQWPSNNRHDYGRARFTGMSPAASGYAKQPLAWSKPLAEALRERASSTQQEAQHSGVPALHLAAAVKPWFDS